MRTGSRAMLLALSCVGLFAFTSSVRAEEPKPAPKLVKSGTVTVTAGQAGIGVADVVWGHGELTALGKTRKFRFNGMGVGAGGGAKITATGTVYNLNEIGLFAGVYSAGGIGAVAGKDETGTAVWLHNTNDVTIKLDVIEKSGFAITGGANGVLVQFVD